MPFNQATDYIYTGDPELLRGEHGVPANQLAAVLEHSRDDDTYDARPRLLTDKNGKPYRDTQGNILVVNTADTESIEDIRSGMTPDGKARLYDGRKIEQNPAGKVTNVTYSEYLDDGGQWATRRADAAKAAADACRNQNVVESKLDQLGIHSPHHNLSCGPLTSSGRIK